LSFASLNAKLIMEKIISGWVFTCFT